MTPSGSEILLEQIRVATADEYRIEREIGRGGMAAVFLAQDIALQRRVAIKVMLPDLINVQGVEARFVIEARTAAHLDHPGIVAVYAVRERAGLLFIVMKYIEGHTLEAVLRSQGQIEPIATALIGSRVAEALAFAHGEGVVHRDVKPSNIMIDSRGRPVVTDFGIARMATAQSITVAGSMLGTPTHMSPEQCRGLPATPASDQYALGVTIYEMLTGRVPFTGSLFELITAHREQTPPPLSDYVAGVDPGLEQTVMRMLAKEPAERWGSMNEVVQRLSSHTSVQRGGENLRATLMLSGTGSHLATPERGSPAVDVLTPPGGVSGAAPPLPVSGPPSPVPVSAPPPPVASPVPSPVPQPAGKPAGRGIIWGSAGLLMAIAVAAVLWTGRESATTTPPARVDTASHVTQTRADSDSVARAAAAARELAVRDSVALAVRDSTARDSVAKDSLAKDSVAKAAAAVAKARAEAEQRRSASTRSRPDSGRSKTRSDATPVECARLLERQSLGEKLTGTERALLQRCPR